MTIKDKKQAIIKRNGLLAEDFYINANGFIVFTSVYHEKRGYCCKSKCLHCPYSTPASV